MSEKKRKQGQHKDGCACVFCKRKGKSAPAPAVTAMKDEHDRKLDHFQYTMDPKEAAIWEHDEAISPLHVPNEIKKRYPGMTFRWVSDYKMRTKGQGYNGWQRFSDSRNPDGIKRGNDLHLAAMPTEMAESYRRSVSERSNRAMRAVAENTIENMEQRAAAVRGGAEMLGPDEIIKDSSGNRRPVSGVSIAGGRRGMGAHEFQEALRKRAEERSKNKVYSFMGRK